MYMPLPEQFSLWCIDLLTSDIFQQTAPLLFVILFPLFILLLANTAHQRVMGFGDSLAITLPPWLWLSSSSASGDGSSARGSAREKKKSKKHGARTRADQAALNGSAKHGAMLSAFSFKNYPLNTYRF